jgi:hypothetical protein
VSKRKRKGADTARCAPRSRHTRAPRTRGPRSRPQHVPSRARRRARSRTRPRRRATGDGVAAAARAGARARPRRSVPSGCGQEMNWNMNVSTHYRIVFNLKHGRRGHAREEGAEHVRYAAETGCTRAVIARRRGRGRLVSRRGRRLCSRSRDGGIGVGVARRAAGCGGGCQGDMQGEHRTQPQTRKAQRFRDGARASDTRPEHIIHVRLVRLVSHDGRPPSPWPQAGWQKSRHSLNHIQPARTRRWRCNIEEGTKQITSRTRCAYDATAAIALLAIRATPEFARPENAVTSHRTAHLFLPISRKTLSHPLPTAGVSSRAFYSPFQYTRPVRLREAKHAW